MIEKFDTIVIGGGPSGLIAAVRASSLGERVALIEKNDSLGEKLLLSGRGRCNFTNAEEDMNAFISRYGDNGKFLFSAFSKFGPAQTIEFFRRNGVDATVERGKRVFPASGGSQRILDTLLMLCKKYKVRIFRSNPVKSIRLNNSLIEYVITELDELSANKYIIATGGLSYPWTGSTGDGYRFARQAGHTITKTWPALVPVKTQETWVKLANRCDLRNVRISVFVDEKKVDEKFGEMEFTNFGMSGPIIMELSSHVPDWRENDRKLQFSLDLKPTLTYEILIKRVKREIEKHSGKKRFAGLIRTLVPARLVPLILELSDVPHDKPVEYISSEEVYELVKLLKDIRMTINGLWSFNNAVVTRGGVDLKEVDPSTMRSKLCSNLFFAGEALDLNGPSGGFNLQICWSTGWVAGTKN